MTLDVRLADLDTAIQPVCAAEVQNMFARFGFDLVAVALAGSWAKGTAIPSSDLDVIVLVAAATIARRRTNFEGWRLDEFVYPLEHVRRELQLGEQDHLVCMMSEAKILYDPRNALAECCALAKQMLSQPRPEAPGELTFLHRSHLTDLYRKLENALNADDQLQFALVRNHFVVYALKHFFRVRRRYNAPIKDILAAVGETDAQLEADLKELVVANGDEAHQLRAARDVVRGILGTDVYHAALENLSYEKSLTGRGQR